MLWITRSHVHVDRVACPWLIQKFVDPEAEFLYLPADTKWDEVKDAIPYDAPGVELGHHGPECSFDAIIKKYKLTDPALALLAKIVRAADTDDRSLAPEGFGLEAIADGFRRIARDDLDNQRLQFPVYDALYAFCQAKVSKV
jgi:hypothetical protein